MTRVVVCFTCDDGKFFKSVKTSTNLLKLSENFPFNFYFLNFYYNEYMLIQRMFVS